MHLYNVLLAFSLYASALGRTHTPAAKNVADHHNGTHAGNASLSVQCHRLQELTYLNCTLNNATSLSAIASRDNLTAAEVSQLQVEGQTANLELQKLDTNGTLAVSCHAARRILASCYRLHVLTKLEDLAANTTAQRNLPSSRVAEIKSAAASATPEFQKLSGNATLVAQCQAYTQARKQGLDPTNAAVAALKAENPEIAIIATINSPATSTTAGVLATAATAVTSTPTNAAVRLGFGYEVLGLAFFGAAWSSSLL